MVAFGVDARQITFPDGNVDYSKVHDHVVAIDPYNMTVTLNLINGFSFGRPVWYISMDASNPLAAAIELNTYVPLMSQLLLGMTTASRALLSAFSSPPRSRKPESATIRYGKIRRRHLSDWSASPAQQIRSEPNHVEPDALAKV